MSQTNELKKLQKEWYSKLEAEGFEDIEDSAGRLKRWDSFYFKLRHRGPRFAAKEEYFRIAERFLYSHSFSEKADKLIWKMHSEGLSCREIAIQLKNQGIKTNKDVVNRTIAELRKKAFFRG